MKKIRPKTWGTLTLCWAVITVGTWLVLNNALLTWCNVALTLFMAFMWWLRAKEAK